jgi:nucleoside-diphosphate-sugar epimerase
MPEGVRTATVDLATGAGLDEALAGQDVLIHMAALLFGLGWQDYLRANAAAAKGLVDAIGRLEAGRRPRRVVLVSSLAATGPCAQAPGVGDDAPPAPVSAYGWSKWLVERIFAGTEGLVVLRPPIIYGSGDRGLLPVFRAAARGLGVSPGLFRDFPVSIAHADDVAEALCLCVKEDAHGVYHVSDGEPRTMRDFCKAIGRAMGRRRTLVLHIPLPLMAVAAALGTMAGQVAHRLFPGGRAPSLNLDKWREARQAGWVCDDGRLRRELGYAPSLTLTQGLDEAVSGYRRLGWLEA